MTCRNMGLILPLIAMGALTSGCAKGVDEGGAANNAGRPAEVEAMAEPEAVDAAANEAPGPPTHAGVGRWNGPEGLVLDIQTSPGWGAGPYAIANQDNTDTQK